MLLLLLEMMLHTRTAIVTSATNSSHLRIMSTWVSNNGHASCACPVPPHLVIP
jgi:hypothetical protein